MAESGGLTRGLLELTRPGNAVLAGVLAFVGAFVEGGPRAPETLAAVAATTLAVAGGNTINDYFDRDIDRLNAPDRPLPRGAVTPRQAAVFGAALFGAALVVALALPVAAVVLAGVNLVALTAYTPVFKSRPAVGNAVVAYLAGSVFLFGGLAVTATPGPTLVLAALAALSTFAREIVKDVEDVTGDEAEGLETLPVTVGIRTSLLVSAALLGVAVLASPVPYLLETFGPGYIVAVALADAVFVYGAYASFSDPTAGQTYLKYGMVVAAAAFVAGRTTVG